MSKRREFNNQRGLIMVPPEYSSTGKQKGLHFSATVSKEARKDMQGLYGGRIVVLVIQDNATGKVLAVYDRGWLLEPLTIDAEAVIGILLLDFDGVQYDDVTKQYRDAQ